MYYRSIPYTAKSQDFQVAPSFAYVADAKPKRDSQEDIVQVVSVAVLSTLANSPQEVRLLVQCNTYSNTFLFVRSTFVLV